MVHLVHEYNVHVTMAIQGPSMDGPPRKIVQEYNVHVHVAMAIQGQSVKGLQWKVVHKYNVNIRHQGTVRKHGIQWKNTCS